jgi:DNA polymerase III sliding clamp (beta) subunit (PCNA family)
MEVDYLSFKLQLGDLGILKSLVNSICNISTDFCFTVDENGLSGNGINTGHTLFYTYNLEPSVFNEFSVSEKTVVNVDCDEIKKVMSRAGSSDVGYLSIVDDELNIIFEGNSKRSYTLRLQESVDEGLDLPQIDLECKLNLPLSVIKDGIKDTKLFSDQLIILEVNPDKVIISGKSDKSKFNVEYIHGEKVNGNYRSTFDVSLFEDAISQVNFTDSIELQLGTNKPIKVITKLVTEDGNYQTLIAPRIEEEV